MSRGRQTPNHKAREGFEHTKGAHGRRRKNGNTGAPKKGNQSKKS